MCGSGLKSASKKRVVFQGDYDTVYEGYKLLNEDGKLLDEGKKCKEGKKVNPKSGRCINTLSKKQKETAQKEVSKKKHLEMFEKAERKKEEEEKAKKDSSKNKFFNQLV